MLSELALFRAILALLGHSVRTRGVARFNLERLLGLLLFLEPTGFFSCQWSATVQCGEGKKLEGEAVIVPSVCMRSLQHITRPSLERRHIGASVILAG